MKTEQDEEDDSLERQEISEAVHDNPEQMLDDLQNPMSVAPPSVAPSDYSNVPPSPGGFSAPPTPYQPEDSTIDDDPDSPPRPPRPDTANSLLDRKCVKSDKTIVMKFFFNISLNFKGFSKIILFLRFYIFLSQLSQPPTPITASFGNIQPPMSPMTPMSQQPMTPQPMPDQPPTPISFHDAGINSAPPSPMPMSNQPPPSYGILFRNEND